MCWSKIQVSRRALYDAFNAAKNAYVERLKRGEGEHRQRQGYRSLIPLMGDPLPYGMKANRASIDALMTYALQQKLIPERMPLDQAFFDPEHLRPPPCPSSTSILTSSPPTTCAVRCSRSAATEHMVA